LRDRGADVAGYVASFTKKLKALARKRSELRRLIERGGTEAEIAQAQEEVRLAQVKVAEAKSAQERPCSDDPS